MSLPDGPFDVQVIGDNMIPMRDGVCLATDVYLPIGLTSVPALLERTPYDKTGANHADVTVQRLTPYAKPEVARYFASHGFAFVLQDCRGRYRSEGAFHKYVNEAHDGLDTILWLTSQPWSNRQIGTLGLSYCAHVQAAVGSLGPAALGAQFLDSGGFSSAYHSGIRQGGAYELKQATWAYKQALLSPLTQADPQRRKALEAQDISAWFTRMPWRRGHSPLSAAPEYEAYLFEQWERGEFDDYWRQLGLHAAGYYEQYADVPMVHMSGWYDPYARTACENFSGLSRRKRGPVHLIMGPWTHGRRSDSWAGDVDFGPLSTFDAAFGASFFDVRLRWFQYALGGTVTNPFARGRVAFFVMGGGSGRRTAAGRIDHGGEWRWANDWPLKETQFQKLYLHGSGKLDFDTPTTAEDSRSFIYDPAHPLPTMGGALTSGEPVMSAGAFDQRDDLRFFGCKGHGHSVVERADVCSFISGPLQSDLVIAGPLVVRLWVASDCPDTDFTVKLLDVFPPTPDDPHGFAMNLSHGILRMRYHRSWERPELLEPRRVYEVSIDAFPTANRFVQGHRIRLDISSSNYPQFDLNPNTGEPQGAWRSMRIARNTIWLDRKRPSHIVLPVIAATR